MTKGTQPFLICALTTEECTIDQSLQAGAQRIEHHSDDKDERADQISIIKWHGDRKDRTESADQQSIGGHNEDGQRRIHHSLAHPIIGPQEPEAQDHISIRQWEEDKWNKEVRVEGKRVPQSWNDSSQGRV